MMSKTSFRLFADWILSKRRSLLYIVVHRGSSCFTSGFVSLSRLRYVVRCDITVDSESEHMYLTQVTVAGRVRLVQTGDRQTRVSMMIMCGRKPRACSNHCAHAPSCLMPAGCSTEPANLMQTPAAKAVMTQSGALDFS